MSTPSPAERLAARLAHLPPDGIRALEAALDHAAARARSSGREWAVGVTFEVSEDGGLALWVMTRHALDESVTLVSGSKGLSPRQ